MNTEISILINNYLNRGIIPGSKDIISSLPPEMGLELNQVEVSMENIFFPKSLRELIDQVSCEEIKFFTFNNYQITEKEQKKIEHISLEEKEYVTFCKFLLIKNKKELNSKNAFCSFSTTLLKKPVRITLFYESNKKLSYPKLIIRFFSKKTPALQSFFSNECHEGIIKDLILNKKNILIAGGTGSGKTTFLKSILENQLDKNENIIIIEDLKELPKVNETTTNLCTSELGFDLNELISWSMRLTPERIVLGEIRHKEALAFIEAMNVGVNGSMATIHASSAKEAIDRLIILLALYHSKINTDFFILKKFVSKLVNSVIFLEGKKVKEIIEIKGTSDQGALFFNNLIK